jgi:protein involved in polysaccharide export with SLBB domain
MNLRRVVVLGWLAILGSVAVPETQAANYLVNSGDVLDITIYAAGAKQENFTPTVSADGTIMCPMIGQFKVGGMTIPVISENLQRAVQSFYVNPNVLVNVKEHGGKVFVVGEVRQPGMHPLGPGLTALAACIVAGGFTDFAKPKGAKVLRSQNGKTHIIRVDLVKVQQGKAEDVPLLGGDRVEIPRRLF